jgi:hypothetical protein
MATTPEIQSRIMALCQEFGVRLSSLLGPPAPGGAIEAHVPLTLTREALAVAGADNSSLERGERSLPRG